MRVIVSLVRWSLKAAVLAGDRQVYSKMSGMILLLQSQLWFLIDSKISLLFKNFSLKVDLSNNLISQGEFQSVCDNDMIGHDIWYNIWYDYWHMFCSRRQTREQRYVFLSSSYLQIRPLTKLHYLFQIYLLKIQTPLVWFIFHSRLFVEVQQTCRDWKPITKNDLVTHVLNECYQTSVYCNSKEE